MRLAERQRGSDFADWVEEEFASVELYDPRLKRRLFDMVRDFYGQPARLWHSSGCRIEDRQLETAESLETCLALDMVVAWRICHVTMLGREVPDLPCTIFFEEAEWKALYILVNQTTDLPAKEPTSREAVRMVASLGGFLAAKAMANPVLQHCGDKVQRLESDVALYRHLRLRGCDPIILDFVNVGCIIAIN